MKTVRQSPQTIREYQREKVGDRQKSSVTLHRNLHALRIEHAERIDRRKRHDREKQHQKYQKIVGIGKTFPEITSDRGERTFPLLRFLNRILPLLHIQTHDQKSRQIQRADGQKKNPVMDLRKSEEIIVESDPDQQTDDSEQSVEPSEKPMGYDVVDQSAEQCACNDRRKFEERPEKTEEAERDAVRGPGESRRKSFSDRRAERHARHRSRRDRRCEQKIRNSSSPAAPAVVRFVADDRTEKQSERIRKRHHHQTVDHVRRPVPFEHQLNNLRNGTFLHRPDQIPEQQQNIRTESKERVGKLLHSHRQGMRRWPVYAYVDFFLYGFFNFRICKTEFIG